GARLKLVALIGAIVAATIISVIVAVVTSARHADAIAIAQERGRLARTISHLADRTMHELASVAMSPRAVRAMRDNSFDSDRVDRWIGPRLAAFFEHDVIFVVDGADRVVYTHFGRHGDDRSRFDTLRRELAPVLDQLRGRTPTSVSGTIPKQIERVE